MGDTKTFTIVTDPVDATDSTEVITATAATSSDTAIVTVTKNGAGFDAAIAGEGTATINFTSGSLTTSIAVTGQAAG